MKKIYSILLLAALCFCGNMQAEESVLKIGTNDSQSANAPVYVTWADAYYCSQILYSASELSAMDGSKITKLAFFLRAVNTNGDYSSVQIRFLEVNYDAFAAASFVAIDDATLVYEGSLPAGDKTTLEVELSAPFEYKGGTLLVDVRKTEKGGRYAPTSGTAGRFQATYGVTYTVLYNYGNNSFPTSAYRSETRPDIQFTYGDGVAVTCAEVGAPVASEITATSATLTWEKAGDVENYQFECVRKGETPTWAADAQNVLTVTLDTLKAFTEYDFYVRAYCGSGEGEQGNSKKVSFQTERSCFAPTSLNVAENDVTTTTAKVTWGASGKGETSWQYTFEEWSDEVPDWSNAVVTDQTEVTLTDLTPKKMYQVWVRSFCADDDQSEAVTTYFSTKVDCSAAALPFEEDFSGDIECWTLTNCISGTGVSTDEDFRFKWNTAPQYLITPELPASAKQIQVDFDYKSEGSYYPESFKLGYSTTDKELTSFTWGEEVTNITNTTFKTYSEILPAGVKFIAIQCTSDDKYYLHIDNFKASEYEAPSCAAPTALTVSEVADKTAKATWTSEAEKFALELKAEGGEWTAVDAVITEPAFELTNLNEHTTYQVRVKAICGEELESEWVESEAFTTSCSVKEFGYEETFAAELDACWDNSTFHGNQWTPTTDDEQDYFLRYKTSDNAFGKAELVSPAIALPNEGEPVLLFYWMNTGVPGVTLKIWDGETESVLSEDLDAELNEVTGEADDRNWQIKKANLSEFLGKTVAFKLHADGNAKNKYAFFDNFKVCQKPYSLLVPTNVQAVATEDGAVITWTAAWDEPAWDLQYGPKDANKTVVPGISEKTYTITGLSEGEYEVQVRAAFAAEPSAWTAVVTFEVAHEATGIDNTAAKATATKRIVNGQLIIERNGEQYNAQGVSVK